MTVFEEMNATIDRIRQNWTEHCSKMDAFFAPMQKADNEFHAQEYKGE